MESRPKISIPLEKELLVYQIKTKLHTLSREELEDFFSEMANLLVKLTYQSQALFDYVLELEGKLEELS
jgi:uncharacterized membrane-anchored protein YhcB (DUF1043 family)